MNPQWNSQPGEAFYMAAPSQQDAYPLDMIDLFPFDDSMFPIQDSSSSTLQDDMNSIAYRQRQSDSPYTMPDPSSSGHAISSTSPDSLSFDTSNHNSPEDINSWLLNPTTGEVTLSSEGDVTKRSRSTRDDNISSCWKSPLCPNKMPDGGRPDSCKGECADYLFAHPEEMPEDKKILSDILAKSEPKVALEGPRRSKRSEMEDEPSTKGREITSVVTKPREMREMREARETKQSRAPSTYHPSPPSPSTPTSSKPKTRVPHNQVEKKYRENVNAQLEALRRVVPASTIGFDSTGGLDIEDLAAGSSSSRQPSKAVVLASATAYIRQLEKENARMTQEMEALKGQNRTLQQLVKCEDCSLMKYVRRWKIQGAVG